jgi:hypothetical protein
MLNLNSKDLEIYKNNLGSRKRSFFIDTKRGEKNIIVAGRNVAKLKRNNSISNLGSDDSKSILSLFASVKKSVNRYIVNKNFQIPVVPKRYNSVFVNRPLFDTLPVGSQFFYIDVKHCYWRIAFLQGVITDYYYNKVLEKPDLKLYRNMALACVIAGREREYYPNGEFLMKIREDNSLHEQIYKNLRHTAWNIFGRLCFEQIGEDNCIGYYTDGILVFPDDLKTVKAVLARHKLQHRIIPCEKTAHREYVYIDEGDIRRI